MPLAEEQPRVDRGRSQFARGLLGLFGMFQEALQGTPQRSLGDLASGPDHVLGEMVPVFREGQDIFPCQDGLYRLDEQGREIRLYSIAAHEQLMVAQYDCGRNLQTIADTLATQTELTSEQAFAATKDLFLRLCREGWCHPAAAHLTDARGDQNYE